MVMTQSVVCLIVPCFNNCLRLNFVKINVKYKYLIFLYKKDFTAFTDFNFYITEGTNSSCSYFFYHIYSALQLFVALLISDLLYQLPQYQIRQSQQIHSVFLDFVTFNWDNGAKSRKLQRFTTNCCDGLVNLGVIEVVGEYFSYLLFRLWICRLDKVQVYFQQLKVSS